MGRTAFRTTPAVFALVVALAGCGGENPFGIVTTEGGDFPVTVTGDVTPTYDWTAGNGRLLVVFRVSDGFQVWRIDAVAGEGFSPPVDHGFVPTGASETVEAEVLASGTEYRVEVTLTDGRQARQTFVR